MSEGLLVVLSGPSGVGKGTICRELCRINPSIKLSVSMTTRKPREGEVEGENYLFTSREYFQELIAKGQLLEWAIVYGNYYGTPREFVERMLISGENVILEIDTQGALQVRNKFPQGVFVFLIPPSLKVLRERIRRRGTESAEKIMERMQAAIQEINQIEHYDYIVLNDRVSRAARSLNAIINAEQCRVKRNRHLINNLLAEGDV
ncbi:MAG: guanylate kinase [Dethiobacteria bacterium]|jgi:guanylate kinase